MGQAILALACTFFMLNYHLEEGEEGAFLRIRWPTRVSNKQVTDTCIMPVNRISDEIRRCRWHWIENVLCGDKSGDCMVALGW